MKKTIVVCLLLLSPSLFGLWTHLELGAGNYGAKGVYAASAIKEFVMTVSSGVAGSFSIADPESEVDVTTEYLDPYTVLYDTLDGLVTLYGTTGVFHINDFVADDATYAASKLQTYATAQGYNSVTIATVAGDYTQLNPAVTLSAYGVTRYDSVHLKHPEVGFFNAEIDASHAIATSHSRAQARARLQTLANYSSNGLFLFVIYDDWYFPAIEKSEYSTPGTFYRPTVVWSALGYTFPDGSTVSAGNTRVFFIAAN